VKLHRLLLVVLLAIVACAPSGAETDEGPAGDDPEETPATNDIDEELTRGQVDSNNAYPWVVKIPGCTATKIEERKYLTAAHCVSNVILRNDLKLGPEFFPSYRGLPKPFRYSKKRVETNAESDAVFDKRLNIVAVDLHPSWTGGVAPPAGVSLDTEKKRWAYLRMKGGKDVAVITVDKPDDDVPYRTIVNTKAAPAQGAIVTVVGAGFERPAVTGWRIKFGSKQVVTRDEILQVFPAGSAAADSVLDMSAYMFQTKRFDTSELPTNDEYAALEGGDSGGPVMQGGRIVGVNSGTYRHPVTNAWLWDDHVSTASIAGWLRAPDVLCATAQPHNRPPYQLTPDACECGMYQRWDGDKCIDDASNGCFVDRSRTFTSIIVSPQTVAHPLGPDHCGREYPALYRIDAGSAVRSFATAAFAGAPVDATGTPIDVYAWMGPDRLDRDRRRDVLYRSVDTIVEKLSAATIPKTIPVVTSYTAGSTTVTTSLTATLHEAGANPVYYPDTPSGRCNIQARSSTGPTRWLTYIVKFADGADRGLQVIVERPFNAAAANMARFDGHVGKVYVSFNAGKHVFLIPPGFSKWLRNVQGAGTTPSATCTVRPALAVDGSGTGINYCELDSVSRTLTEVTTAGAAAELPSIWLPDTSFAVAATTLNHTRYASLAGNIGRDLVLMSRHHSMSVVKPADAFDRATGSHWLRAPTVQSGDVHRVLPLQWRASGYYTLSAFPNAVGASSLKVSIAAKVYHPGRCGAPETCFGAAGSNCTSPNVELSAAGLCLPAANTTNVTCFVSGISQLHDQCCSRFPSETGCGGTAAATNCGGFLNAAKAEFVAFPLDVLKGLLTNGVYSRPFWRETFPGLDIKFSNVTNLPKKRLLTFSGPPTATIVKRDEAGFRAPNGTSFGSNPAIFNGSGETGENWCKTATATPAGSVSKPFACGPASASGGGGGACIIEGNPTGPAPAGKGYKFYCTAEIQGRCSFSQPVWTAAWETNVTTQPISCSYTTSSVGSCGPGMAQISPIHCGLGGGLTSGCCDLARNLRCSYVGLVDLASVCN
jgi:hypothetical protein